MRAREYEYEIEFIAIGLRTWILLSFRAYRKFTPGISSSTRAGSAESVAGMGRRDSCCIKKCEAQTRSKTRVHRPLRRLFEGGSLICANGCKSQAEPGGVGRFSETPVSGYTSTDIYSRQRGSSNRRRSEWRRRWLIGGSKVALPFRSASCKTRAARVDAMPDRGNPVVTSRREGGGRGGGEEGTGFNNSVTFACGFRIAFVRSSRK